MSDLPTNSITIQWIPSHTGIEGNENADFLAKESLKLNFITKAPYSIPDALRISHKFYSNRNNSICNPCSHNNNISFPPQPYFYSFLLEPRYKQTILSPELDILAINKR